MTNPATGGFLLAYIPEACTVTAVRGIVAAATSATFNVEERSLAGVQSAGTDILSSDLVADVDEQAVTGGFANAAIASNSYLYVDISATSGTPGKLTGLVQVTVP